MKTPILHRIDLSKCCRKKGGYGESHHPDISARKQYLVLIDGSFYAGQFCRQWFGWNFEGGPWDAGYQLDKPGTNASLWQGIWEIVK